MRRKRCCCCHKLYWPHPQTYRQQKTCDKEFCRAWRLQEKWKLWSRKNPLYGQSRKGKLRLWRQEHPGYWKAWRKQHPYYVSRNRLAQKARNAKNRRWIAKPTEWSSICIDKLRQIVSLRLIAKPTAWEDVLIWKIDGICRYLKAQVLIAKPTDIDRRL